MFAGPTMSVQWGRQGAVLTAGVGDNSNVLEPTILYEANAQILAGTVFKMWYTGGWGNLDINYAESSDGAAWTKYDSNPVLADHARSCILKVSATYYLYAAKEDDSQIDLYTSADGLSWSLDTAAVIPLGGAGAWDDTHVANCHVWKEGASDWRMLYEANHSTGAYHIGYATSSDGQSWSKSGSNPVINETGSTGGPFVYKASDGAYWLWVHHSSTGFLPTNLERYKSTNLTSWTKNPADRNTLIRLSADEGVNTTVGQVADPMLIEVGNQVYLFYSASTDGTQAAGALRIKLAIAPMTFEKLIRTLEG